MAQNDFRRQEFIDAVSLVASVIAERFYDNSPPDEQHQLTLSQPPDEDVLTRAEAAKLLKVHTGTIDRMRRKGQLRPVKKLLPIVRYRREDVARFINHVR